MVRSARTPPSTFLFLLFSFQTARCRSTTFTRSIRPRNLQTHPTTIRNRRPVGCQFTHLDEELLETKTRASANGHGGAASIAGFICPALAACQRQSQQIVATPSGPCDQAGRGSFFPPNAVLEPQCCDVLSVR